MCLQPGNAAVKRQLNARRREDRPKFANAGYQHMKQRLRRQGGRPDDGRRY
jgi:hypothetical protein